MGLILHLSDLHLSTPETSPVVGDYKVAGIVPDSEMQNRLGIIQASLRALSHFLTSEQKQLDAMVITGDISWQCQEAGFSALTETLACLEGHALPPEQTIIVPGNHDVHWGTLPSVPARYELFAKYIVAKGYVTPLLEGIDISARNGALIGARSPIYVAPDRTFAVVGLNSTDYCGSTQKLDVPIEEAFEQARHHLAGQPERLQELNKLLIHDVARITPGQLIALQGALNALDPPEQGGPVRILALHHQLQPASLEEEFKTFETITNLGELRSFLSSQHISLVLHGHKHTPALYIDAASRPNSDVEQQYLVSSAGTVWREAVFGREFARLIEVDVTYPFARQLKVYSVPVASVGSDFTQLSNPRNWRLPAPASTGKAASISGRTVDEVYDNVRALFDEVRPGTVYALTCRVEDGSSARTLPSSYPDIEGVPNDAKSRQDWLNEIVEWWQRKDPVLTSEARRFNHGERIRNLTSRGDQIRAVVTALDKAPGTTRGIIQLIDPAKDDIANPDQRIPSFFSCHFIWREQERLLDCIAYFRKQQMRMWWPVNLCELCRLQEEVVSALRALGKEVVAGSITTIAALAVDGTKRPRLIVPKIDRQSYGDPTQLWALAYDLFFGDYDAACQGLLNCFADWTPTEDFEADGTAVSVEGLKLLQQAVEFFAQKRGSRAGIRLARDLAILLGDNVTYASAEERTADLSERRENYFAWARRVKAMGEDIDASLVALGAEGSATVS